MGTVTDTHSQHNWRGFRICTAMIAPTDQRALCSIGQMVNGRDTQALLSKLTGNDKYVPLKLR